MWSVEEEDAITAQFSTWQCRASLHGPVDLRFGDCGP
jgi:hypothetical protein